VATLLTLIFGSILIFVLLISIITELIESSKVPKSYFKIMFLSILAPALAATIYVFIIGGKIDWMIN